MDRKLEIKTIEENRYFNIKTNIFYLECAFTEDHKKACSPDCAACDVADNKVRCIRLGEEIGCIG